MKGAFVTLVTSPDFAIGALALAKSMKSSLSSFPLVVLTTDSGDHIEALEKEGCIIKLVALPDLSDDFKTRHSKNEIHSKNPFTKGTKPVFHDPLMNFCKLRAWELEAYETIVFLDADTLVIQNIDKLFYYPEFSAAPNLYETLDDFNRLNSGVFVAKPNKETFENMLRNLDKPDKYWKRTDQTFLQHFWKDWHGLPIYYNMLQYVYSNLPQLWNWEQIKVIHYQYEKPWQKDHPKKELLKPLIKIWEQVYETGNFQLEI